MDQPTSKEGEGASLGDVSIAALNIDELDLSEPEKSLLQIERSIPHSNALANAYLNFTHRVLEISKNTPTPPGGAHGVLLPRSREELYNLVLQQTVRKQNKPASGSFIHSMIDTTIIISHLY